MALNFPSSPITNQTYTDDNNITWIFDGVKWEVYANTHFKLFDGVKCKIATDYNLTDTSTAISFDNIEIDVGDYHSSILPTRVTINKTGFYRINLSLFSSSIGAAYNVSIKKNGTTELSSAAFSPSQFINYDEILELNSGEYIQVYVSETSSTGAILSSGFTLEVTREGLTLGSIEETFSGVKTIIDNEYFTSDSATAISWEDVEFDQYSNAGGDNYWSPVTPSVITIGKNGFFRVKGVLITSNVDNYVFNLKKNDSDTLTSISVGANNTIQIDEIYQFSANDYLKLFVNDSASTGSLTTDSYLEIIQIGI